MKDFIKKLLHTRIVTETITIHSLSFPGLRMPTFQKAKIKYIRHKFWKPKKVVIMLHVFANDNYSLDELKTIIARVTLK